MREEWRNVEDFLPEKHQNVIAWAPNGKDQTKRLVREVYYMGGRFYQHGFYANELYGVTHWQPLPNPPTED